MKKSFSQKQVSSICGRYLLAAGLFFIGLLAFLAIGVSTGHGASPPLRAYHLTDLGVLPAKKASISIPAAINDQGQVAGTSGMSGVDESAFLYDPKNNKGMLEDLARNYGGISHGYGINGAGHVVGDLTFDTSEPVSHAALFVRYGKIIDLGTLEGTVSSKATGINASGLVVGFCVGNSDGSMTRGFLWNPSMGMIDIGTLGGAWAQAFGINDSGLVTGTSQVAESSRDGVTHAFIYNPFSMSIRNMIDLGTLGGSESVGTAINANNHVVGYSTLIPANDRRVHAFLYDGMKMRDLGSLETWMAADQSYALGVNILDQVVGYAYVLAGRDVADPDPPVRQAAFIYTKGEMMNLNGLIEPVAAKSYWLRSATGINSQGQIVAIAEDLSTTELHAVLLTP